MGATAKVVADSISKEGVRLTTLQLRYWRAVHGEMMTHRVFSRNASSSRAIPVKKMLAQVWNDPAGPIHWGKNQSGMQAEGQLQGVKRKLAGFLWRTAGKVACLFAWGLMKLGLHKQAANRILEPWQYIEVVLSSTEWSNFFKLRDHRDAQPEIKALAVAMDDAMRTSAPVRLEPGQWHTPYVSAEEKKFLTVEGAVICSTARNARVSYLTHDRKEPSIVQDAGLHDRLVVSEPMHASPAEHPAMPDRKVNGKWQHPHLHGNFVGWIQYRKLLEHGLSI